MKNDFSLSIPTPCFANWNDMTPVEQGRFCGLCSLKVVDFTSMSDEEIKHYFLCHQEQKTCGRFNTSQLANTKENAEGSTPIIGRSKIKAFFKEGYVKASVFSFITLLALLVGCRRPSTYPPKMGKVHTMGDVQYIEKVDTTDVLPKPVNPSK